MQRTLCFFLLVPFVAGCGNSSEKGPLISFTTTGLLKKDNGMSEGMESAGVVLKPIGGIHGTASFNGHDLSYEVKTINADQATFVLTYPDKATEEFTLKASEKKDCFGKEKAFGVRIHMKEIKP